MINPKLIPTAEQRSWSRPPASTLTREAILGLFENKIPYLRLPKAVSLEHCERLAKECESAGFEYYDDIIPPVGRIGVTQYEYRHRMKREYFEAARQAERKHRHISDAAGYDPLGDFVRDVRRVGLSVHLAKENDLGLEYGSRLVRQIPMAKLHMDFAALCAQGWDIGNVQQQLTFNLYLREPQIGGECLIYDRIWELEDDALLDEVQPLSSYGYPAKVVEGVRSECVRPERGDIVLFNTRNFHQVAPSSGSVARLSLTTFFGRLKSDEIVFWS